jgi:anthranilate 1,2-dioxygenase small subunit
MQPLRDELRDFYDDYVHCIDSGELERWPDFFVEDAKYWVTARENYERGLEHGTIYCDGLGMIHDRVLALRKSTVFEPRWSRHLMGGVRIHEQGEPIKTETSYVVYECLSDQEPRLFMVGRYIDKVVRTGEGFRFKERACVYDNYRLMTSLITPI